MKIINLCFADMAGAAYMLSHALNKRPGFHSINIRANNNYIDYPTIADLKFYTAQQIQGMIYDSDVVVYHTAIRPFFTAMDLTAEKLKGKKQLLYFHGSEARAHAPDIVKQADESLGKNNYTVLVSTPDLLQVVPDSVWMPVARSVSEISARFGMAVQDQEALQSFGEYKPRIMMSHAPTDVAKKGSELFYGVITQMVQKFPGVEYQVIQRYSWDQCLRILSTTRLYFDQHLIGAYGLSAVEASIFKAAVFCKLTPDVCEVMRKETGIANPFIQWDTKEELVERVQKLIEDPKLCREFGETGYRYVLKVHDEEPVVNRFLSILKSM